MALPTGGSKRGSAPYLAEGTVFMAKRRFLAVYEAIKYELPVFVLLTAQLIPQGFDFSKDAYASVLVLDYRIGFAPRLFMGSVLSLFTRFKGSRELNIFFAVMFAVCFFLISWTAGRIIRAAADENQKMTVFFVALFLAGPFSTAFLFPVLLSLDRFLVLFTVAILLVIGKPRLRWLTPVFLFMALATHHVFAFTYMPAVAIVVLYELYVKKDKPTVLFATAAFITMAVFCGYFFLYGGTDRFADYRELVAYAKTQTDIPIREDFYAGYFFLQPSSFSNYLFKYTTIEMAPFRRDMLVNLFLLPLIVLFFVIWKQAIQNSGSRFEKFIFLLCLLVPLARIPMYFLVSDLFRGRVGVVVVEFFLLFWMLYYRNEAVEQSAAKVWAFLGKNRLAALMLVAYYAAAYASVEKSEWWRDLFRQLTGNL